MMKLTRFAVLAAAMAALSTSALAQLPTSKVLTMDVAEIIAQAAMARCRADGYKVTVLVVDSLNAPKAMIRDDGATASTTEVAKMKATATMLYNRPSGPAAPPPAGTPAPPATIPGTINAQGGVPIKWTSKKSLVRVPLLPNSYLEREQAAADELLVLTAKPEESA